MDNESIIFYKLSSTIDKDAICKLGRAISSPERIDIIRILQKKPCNLMELSELLNIPVSSVSFHISALEEAKLIRIDYKPASKGHMKLCSLSTIRATLQFAEEYSPDELDRIVIEMPVGLYSECNATNAYLADSENFVFREGSSQFMLFTPERVKGELFAFQRGSVTYSFPNIYTDNTDKRKITVSFECCSEAPFYRENWPSDITVWINDVEIGTTCLPGDFGGKRGIYTPDYWQTNSTQFGLLKSFAIDDSGCYVDNLLISRKHTFSNLKLETAREIKLKIGFKEDAEHIGGINIFGKNFGNYPQAIQMIFSKSKNAAVTEEPDNAAKNKSELEFRKI